jgi:putative FmdB family regulatory protein
MMCHVPVYDFQCGACGERFEELAKPGESVACPVCGGAGKRVYSQVATQRQGLHGGEARRSDAQRKAREDVKRQEFSEKRQRGRERN